MKPEKLELQDFEYLLKTFKSDQDKLKNIYIISILDKNWENIVGAGLSNLTGPLFYNEGILTISISHDTYRMELLFIKEMIFKNCNKVLGNESVKTLKFKKGNVKPRRRSLNKTTPDFNKKENLIKMTEIVTDEETKKKLIELIGVL